jgi:hypothetical protein
MIIQLLIKYCDNCKTKFEDSDETAESIEIYSEQAGWTKRPVPNGSVWDLCPVCSKKLTNELR